MSVFVLVHGGWGGGWQWRRVADRLRQRGHDVFTPTLTGLGDRSHLTTIPVDLSLHIQDVVQMLYFEDLTDVVLVVWSYGGAVVDGVADEIPERLQHVVNLDGEVVQEGGTLVEGWTDEARTEMSDLLEQARATLDSCSVRGRPCRRLGRSAASSLDGRTGTSSTLRDRHRAVSGQRRPSVLGPAHLSPVH